MVRRVLVALDSESDLPLVGEACDLARAHNARLEIVGGVAQPWFTTSYVACPAVLQRDLEAYSCELLRTAVAQVPLDLPVDIRQVRGCARRRLAREHHDRECEIVLTRPRRRSRRDRPVAPPLRLAAE